MKRIIVFIGCVFALFEGLVYAVNQPQRLGAAALQSKTVAQIQALTSNTTGQILYCSDCAANGAAGTICVSTGATAVNQFVLSTGTVCK